METELPSLRIADRESRIADPYSHRVGHDSHFAIRDSGPSVKAAETRRLLESGACLPVTVDGDCMSPTLRRGEVVFVRRAREPRPGDVALIDARGWLEIHRLVTRIQVGPRRWYVHMGDAASLCGVAGPRDVLGLVQTPSRRRPGPALRANLTALFLRLGALLSFLGLWTRVPSPKSHVPSRTPLSSPPWGASGETPNGDLGLGTVDSAATTPSKDIRAAI